MLWSRSFHIKKIPTTISIVLSVTECGMHRKKIRPIYNSGSVVLIWTIDQLVWEKRTQQFFFWFEIDTSFVCMVFFSFDAFGVIFYSKELTILNIVHTHTHKIHMRCLQMRICTKKICALIFFHSMHHYHRTKAAKQPKLYETNTHLIL